MRQRGFSIVEVSIVVFLIIMLTSIVAPSLGAMMRGQAAIGFRQELESVAQRARTQAMRQNRATVIKFNIDGQIGWDFLEEATTDEQIAQDEDDNFELGQVRNGVAPTETTSFTTYELNRENVSQNEWQVGFYPDGTADRAYLEFTMDNQTFVLIVNPTTGTTRVSEGTINDQEEDEWPAGEIEQRVG